MREPLRAPRALARRMSARAPSPDDTREDLYEHARALQSALAEKEAIIARIKAYIAPWKTDKRMRIMGEIFLREIDRIEKEEAERSASGGRGT